jgi:tyrosinase
MGAARRGASCSNPGWWSRKLRVQIQPVALRTGGNADGSAKPASVEVAIVSA